MPRLLDIATQQYWWLFYALGLALATVALGTVHWDIVSAPMALDYYEGQIPLITGVFASGHSPYTYEYQPEYVSLYGLLYNLLMVPVTDLFGNSLPVHRAVNAIFLLASCALIFGISWRQTKHLGMAATASILSYAAMLYYSTPIAAANAMGLFLMLSTAIIPWLLGFSRASLIISALLAIAAFYTKIYFILGALCVGLYMGLRISIARAAGYGLLLLVVGAISVILILESNPYYFDLNYFAATNPDGIWLNNKTLVNQLLEFLKLYSTVWLLLGFALLSAWRRFSRPDNINAHKPKKPLITWSFSRPLVTLDLGFFWLCFAGALLVICISLGRNPGNWMSYLFQLMTPFFVIAAMHTIHRQALLPAIVVPLLLVSLYSSWQFLPKDFDVDLKPWNKLEQLIINNESVLSSQALLMLMVDHDKEIYQDGQTFYFPYSRGKPHWAKHKNPKHQVEQVWRDFIARHYHRVEQQEYDIALLDDWDVVGVFAHAAPNAPNVRGQDYFRRFYKRSHYIEIDLGGMPGGGLKKMGVWKPIAGKKLKHDN